MKKNKNHWDRVKEQTMKGETSARIKKLYEKADPIKIILYNNLCPGDCLAMTSALEALHNQYPGRFITDIRCFHKDIYANNPRVTPINPNDEEAVHLWTTYPLVNKTNQRPIHFLEGYVDWFRTQLDIELVLEVTRPFIYLTAEEKKTSLVEQMTGIKNYILCSNGWKNDYTIKRYSVPYMQEVVDHFKDRIAFAQIGLTKPFHNHPPLKNVINLIDKTNMRQLMTACYHAQAGIGGVTCILHMFNAYAKPYVSLHGAREPVFWTAGHTIKQFSRVGTLECCKEQACWRSRIVPLGDGDKKDKRCCVLPIIDDDGRPIAKCMYDIKPNQIIEYIESLIDSGIIKI